MNDINHSWAVGANALPFEAWLQTGLKHLYDEALEEPVPDELLRLVDPDHRPRSKHS